jgi:hypothetical protein
MLCFILISRLTPNIVCLFVFLSSLSIKTNKNLNYLQKQIKIIIISCDTQQAVFTLFKATGFSVLNIECTFRVCLFVCFWGDSLQWVRASSFTRFLDHIQRRTTLSRTPLDEWSARCKDLYVKTHNTHSRQTSMPPPGFEPTISAGERLQTYALDRAATGTGNMKINSQ